MIDENKKYELVKTDFISTEDGRTLYRIRALVDIDSFLSRGKLGGYIESEKNLSMSGNAWVGGDAWVSGDAQVFGDAWVSGDARVFGNAWVSGDAQVFGDAWVFGNARINKKSDIQWFSGVGSEGGTLTVCKAKRGLFVSRGCFSGTLPQFKKAVKAKHGDSKIGRHYATLIQSIEIWFEV